jgi:hypothetical protein
MTFNPQPVCDYSALVLLASRAMECGEFSPLSAGDLSPSKARGLRYLPASSGWRKPGRARPGSARSTSTATSRLPKAVTSHRTP